MADEGVFDVVIVGAGPAGCVLALRLTEDPARTVALIEAGPDYGPDPAAWPADLRDPIGIWPDSHPWGYLHGGRAADRPLSLPRGKVVGGSSTINACLWLRGSAVDYDGWAILGNPGWSFAEMLPYFKRAEADPIGGPLHGTDGPVPVFRTTEATLSPVDRALDAAAESLGFPRVNDFNGSIRQYPGVGPIPKNVAGGVRMNAAFTYLAPARMRPNFTLMADALIDRVWIEAGRVAAVQAADGRLIQGRQVLLCAGAYGSPAILLRSGIGPADDLRELGVPVVLDRPGVGGHLMDHPILEFAKQNQGDAYVVNPAYSPTAPSFIPTLIKARSSQTPDEIDLHLYHGQFLHEEQGMWAAWFGVSLAYARSQGRVRLTSPDPEATLHIDHGYFTDPTDLEALCDGAELAAQLLSTQPLSAAVTPVPGKAPDWNDRDELRAWVSDRVETTFHPSSTCRMGPATDPTAVVDHAGRVRGIAGLRVVDASIFPTGPHANLHCTVVATAEKLADAIRDDHSE